jgi:hypothetical protein
MRLSATVAAFYFFVFTFLSRRLPDKMRLSAKTSTIFLLFLFTFVRIALQTDCLCTKAHVFFFLTFVRVALHSCRQMRMSAKAAAASGEGCLMCSS